MRRVPRFVRGKVPLKTHAYPDASVSLLDETCERHVNAFWKIAQDDANSSFVCMLRPCDQVLEPTAKAIRTVLPASQTTTASRKRLAAAPSPAPGADMPPKPGLKNILSIIHVTRSCIFDAMEATKHTDNHPAIGIGIVLASALHS